MHAPTDPQVSPTPTMTPLCFSSGGNAPREMPSVDPPAMVQASGGPALTRRTFLAATGGLIGATASGGVLSGRASAAALGPVVPGRTVPFYIGTATNSTFDEPTLRFIADRASILFFQGTIQGNMSIYDYKYIVDRLHTLNPSLKVLIYTWATIGTCVPSGRDEGDILEGYCDLGSLLLPIVPTLDPRFPHSRQRFGDMRQAAFRQWLITRIGQWVTGTDVDGVEIDLSYRFPRDFPNFLNTWCQQNPTDCANYVAGVDTFYDDLRASLPGKVVHFNGLWNLGSPAGALLSNQTQLLQHADGASVEFFGYFPQAKLKQPFDNTTGQDTATLGGIKPYLDLLQANPTKDIAVFGRNTWDYVTYNDDYLWQRYLYCCYLLASSANSGFKYLTQFQQPTAAGRTGGLDYFIDWDMPLGTPTGEYTVTSGVYSRIFSGGRVAIVPHDAGSSANYVLPAGQTFYDPEGVAKSGTISIAPGQGLLLLTSAPTLPTAVTEDFEDPATPYLQWQWSSILSAGATKYLHLDLNKRSPGFDHQHDIAVERVRTIQYKPTIELRYRCNDPKAALRIVIEVVDTQVTDSYLVLDFSATSGTLVTSCPPIVPLPAFRLPRDTGNPSNAPNVPQLKMGATLNQTGTWVTATLNANTILAGSVGGRYFFRRWSHIRVLGSAPADAVPNPYYGVEFEKIEVR